MGCIHSFQILNFVDYFEVSLQIIFGIGEFSGLLMLDFMALERDSNLRGSPVGLS